MNCNALIYFLSRDQCAKAKLRCPPLESTCDSSTKATLGCPPFFTIFLGQAVGVTWIRLILRVKWHLYHAKVSCIKCHPLCVKGLTSKQQSFCIKILQNKDLLRQLTSTATIKFIYSEKATNFCEVSTAELSYICSQRSNLRWRFCKILWPSRNIWTLQNCTTPQAFVTFIFIILTCFHLTNFFEKNSSGCLFKTKSVVAENFCVPILIMINPWVKLSGSLRNSYFRSKSVWIRT